MSPSGLYRVAQSAVQRVGKWLRWLGERITREPGYAEALAGMTIAAAELLVPGDRLRRVIVGGAHTFVVIARSTLRQPRADDLEPIWD